MRRGRPWWGWGARRRPWGRRRARERHRRARPGSPDARCRRPDAWSPRGARPSGLPRRQGRGAGRHARRGSPHLRLWKDARSRPGERAHGRGSRQPRPSSTRAAHSPVRHRHHGCGSRQARPSSGPSARRSGLANRRPEEARRTAWLSRLRGVPLGPWPSCPALCLPASARGRPRAAGQEVARPAVESGPTKGIGGPAAPEPQHSACSLQALRRPRAATARGRGGTSTNLRPSPPGPS